MVKLIPQSLIYKVQEDVNADEDLRTAQTPWEQRMGPFGPILAGNFVKEDVSHEKGLECYKRFMSILAKYGGTSGLTP